MPNYTKESFNVGQWQEYWYQGSSAPYLAKTIYSGSNTYVTMNGVRTAHTSELFPIYEPQKKNYSPDNYFPGAVVYNYHDEMDFIDIPVEQRKLCPIVSGGLFNGGYGHGPKTTVKASYANIKNFIKNAPGVEQLKCAPRIAAIYDFDTPEGVLINGRIDASFFGLSKENCQSVRVFELRLERFALELYSGMELERMRDGTDFFNDKLNFGLFSDEKRPMVIGRVVYGTILYVAVATKKANASQATMDIKSNTPLSVKGVRGNVIVKMRLIGSSIKKNSAEYTYKNCDSSSGSVGGLDLFNKIIWPIFKDSEFTEPLPVLYNLHDLYDYNRILEYRVKKYYSISVNKITLEIGRFPAALVGFNSLKIHWLSPVYDSATSQYFYRHMSVDKKPEFKIDIHPASICLEFKVDVMGSNSKDFNFFIPYIPLSKFRIDDDGLWWYYIELHGYTLGSVEGNVAILNGYQTPESWWAEDNQVYLRRNNFYDGCETTCRNWKEQDWLNKYLAWRIEHSRKLKKLNDLTSDGKTLIRDL